MVAENLSLRQFPHPQGVLTYGWELGSLWGVVVPGYLSSLSPAVLDVQMRAQQCHPKSMVCHCPSLLSSTRMF